MISGHDICRIRQTPLLSPEFRAPFGKIANAASTGFAANYYAFRLHKVLALLRKSESYWLVGYLPLSQPAATR